MKKFASWLIVCILTVTMLGCGGGAGTTSSGSAVTGVATPAGISVVTAK